MTKPTRKQNRLNGFDYGRSGAYFVTICVQDRRPLLSRIHAIKPSPCQSALVGDDAHVVPPSNIPQVQLSLYGKTAEKFLKTIPGIDTYIIMPNHIHFIVWIKPSGSGTTWASSPTSANPSHSLPRLIASYKCLVTKSLGMSIFQRSYHDRIIRNEEEYRRIRHYILQNPLMWEQDELNPFN